MSGNAGCGNPNCNCGHACSGCDCKSSRIMDNSMSPSFECDTDGCSCASCNNCAPSCGCTSCSANH